MNRTVSHESIWLTADELAELTAKTTDGVLRRLCWVHALDEFGSAQKPTMARPQVDR